MRQNTVNCQYIYHKGPKPQIWTPQKMVFHTPSRVSTMLQHTLLTFVWGKHELFSPLKKMQFTPSMLDSALLCRVKMIFSVIYLVLYWLVIEILLKLKYENFHLCKMQRNPIQAIGEKMTSFEWKATSIEFWNSFNYIFCYIE